MAVRLIAPVPQFVDDNGDPASGYVLRFYAPGTSTPKAVYSDAALSVEAGTSITLNASGEPDTDIYLFGVYKVTLENASGVLQWTRDDFGGFLGAEDLSQWVNALQATYVSGTSFYVPGDYTSGDRAFEVDRRVKAEGSATLYGTVSSASYDASTDRTTVTVTWDSGALIDEALTVWVGILSADNESFPATSLRAVRDLASLRSGIPEAGKRLLIKYHTSEGDEGGGIFRAVTGAAAGTYTDNNGTVIVPTGGDGSAAWLRTLTETITPEMFGAVGDGVADDTAAIAAAIANVDLGGTVLASAARYRLTSTITINRRIRLQGAGAPSIDKADTTGTIFFKDFSGVAIDQTVDGVVLEDFSVDGVAANTGDGIWLHASRPRCSRVHVFNQGGHGILVGDPASAANANLWFLENTRTVSNGGDGIRISSNEGTTADNANAGTLVQSDSSANGGDGVHVGNSRHNVLLNVTVQTNTGRGLYLSPSAKDTNVFGGDTDEGNTGGNVLNEGVATRFFGVPEGGLTDNSADTIKIGRNGSRLRKLSVEYSMGVAVDNGGAIDTVATLTSRGSTAAGRGVAVDAYLPGDAAAVGAQLQFSRRAADLSSKCEILTKTDAGTPEVVFRADPPDLGIVVNIPGVGLRTLKAEGVDTAGTGYRNIRVSN